MKRRAYDGIARFEKKQPLAPALYVFFVKKGAESISFSALSDEIDTLLTKSRDAIVKAPRVV